MRLLKQSTAYDLMVFLTDSADHVAGKTGLTLTITASKAGAAFASISPTVTERGNGWYALALTTSHTDTLGDLALHITASGADPADLIMQVRANVLGDTLPANVTQFGGSNGTFASGRPEVNASHWGGTAVASAVVNANAAQISGDAAAADNLEAMLDGTGGVTVKMASLQVVNPSGTAVTFQSSGSNGTGLAVTGHGTGSGALFTGGSSGGHGFGASGGGAGNGMWIYSAAGEALWIETDTSVGIEVTAGDQAIFLAAGGDGDIQEAVYISNPSTGGRGVTIEDGSGNLRAIHANFVGDITGDVTGDLSGSVGSVTGNVGGNVTGSVGSIASGGITAASIASNAITSAKIATDAIGAAQLAADAVAEIQSGLSTLNAAGVRSAVGLASANLDTQLGAIDDYLDTEIAAIKAKTDNLPASPAATGDIPSAATIADAVWDEAQSGHTTAGTFGKYLDTEVSGVGGGSLTVQDIVDGVWDEPMASHAVSGSTGEALAAAGGAGDPWITSLPGSYTAGQAGYIVGNMLTAAGLRGALYDTGTAQAGGGSSITLESGASSVNSHYNGREIRIVSGTGAGQARFITTYSGTTKIANVHRSWTTQPDSSSVYAIGDTVEVNVRQWVDSNVNVLVSGRVDATVGAMQTDVLTSTALASSAVTEIQAGLSTLDAAGVRTAVGLASANLDTQLDALPTAAENASAVWGAATRELSSGANIVLAKNTGVTGFNDITAASVWGVARSGNQTSGTFGEYVDAAVSSRLASGGYTAPPSASDISTQVASDLATAHGAGSWATATGFSTLTQADIRTAVGLASANLDTQLDAMPTAAEVATAVRSELSTELGRVDAAVSTRLASAGYTAPPTAAEVADKVLGRNLAGSSDGGRTVKDALRFLRNKWTIVGTTLTVYAEDDTTSAWTSTITTNASADNLTSSDPA